MPNTRESVVRLGQLFGREHCRFDEAVVRLYKPEATPTELEQATNPAWPPAGWAPAGLPPVGTNSPLRKPFRYSPPVREYDNHPVIVAVCNALRVQNYSYKTLKNYKQVLIALIRYVGTKPLDKLTKLEYQKYLLFLAQKKRFASSTLNIHINGWKFYQEKILEREKEFYDVAYPRQATKLPTVYSVAEVEALFNATTSLKYRTLFQLVYATGLRLNEVAHLKLTDLDRVRRLIHVRGAKAKRTEL